LNDEWSNLRTHSDGKQYLPLAWTARRPEAITARRVAISGNWPEPRSMELQIRLAGDTSPRNFKWSLK